VPAEQRLGLALALRRDGIDVEEVLAGAEMGDHGTRGGEALVGGHRADHPVGTGDGIAGSRDTVTPRSCAALAQAPSTPSVSNRMS
jgi:hypothetical protein